MNDFSKEEGEISDDDDVQVVGFSKIGEDFDPSKSAVSSGTGVPITRVQPRNAGSLGPGLVDRSRQCRRRTVTRSCYGMSASLTNARERLRNSQQHIPTLMSIRVSPSRKFPHGRSNLLPLTTSNGELSSGIPSTLPAFSTSSDSGFKSKTPVLANLRRIKPRDQRSHIALYDLYANSPASDLDETDYVDMLLEYKKIQKKLDVINQEEGRLVEEEKNKENLREAESTATADSRSDALPTLVDKEEDDDLVTLELRRKCLESLASVTADGMSDQRGSVAQKGRQRLPSFRRIKSPVVLQQNPLETSETKLGPQIGRPPSPMGSRDQPQRRRLPGRPRKRRKRRQSADSEEEFRKFVQSLQTPQSDISEGTKRTNRSARRMVSLVMPSVEDNYDEVEMELDSGCEAIEETATGYQRKVEEMSEPTKGSGEHLGLSAAVAVKSTMHGRGGRKNIDPLGFEYPGVGGISPGCSGLISGDLMPEFQAAHSDSAFLRQGNLGGLMPFLPEGGYLTTKLMQVPGMLSTQFGEDLLADPWLWNSVVTTSTDSNAYFYPVPPSGIQMQFLPGNETNKDVSIVLSDSNGDESEDNEEALLRKLLLSDLAKKKNQQNDSERIVPSETVPCSESVVSLMDLETRPIVQEPSSSKSQPFTLPFQSLRPLPRNQNSQSLASQVRLHSPSISPDFPSSTVLNSALAPSNSSAARRSIVSAGQNVSVGSTSNVLSKKGIASLKITIPVPARKAKTVVPMPQHKPVVISLSGDTDSDSDGNEASVEAAGMPTGVKPLPSVGLSESLLGGLDSLLKEARLASEPKKEQTVPKLGKAEICKDLTVKDASNSKLISKDIQDGLRPQNLPSQQVELCRTDERGDDDGALIKDGATVEAEAVLTKATTAVTSAVVPPVPKQMPSKLVNLGLETWLMDSRKVELKLLARKISQLEKEINSERSQLLQEEQQMKKFELEMTRKRGQYRQSEIRVDKLREQLSATEKILTHNQEQIVVLGKKTQELKSQTLKRKGRLTALKKEMNEAGRRFLGNSSLSATGSKPTDQKSPSVNSQDVKKHSGVVVTAAPGSVGLTHSHSAKVLTPSKSLAAEKKHLEELARMFEQLIESHKKKQAAKINAVGPPSRVRKQDRKPVEHIQTEEKMIFGAGTELYRDTTDIVPKRRRSLLDESPTTTKPIFGKGRLNEESAAAGVGQAKGRETDDNDANADDARLIAVQSIAEARVRQVQKVLGSRLLKQVSDDEIVGLRCSRLKYSDPYLRFQPPVEQVPDIFEIPRKPTNQTAESNLCKPYKSVLMCFKSYRFSPYYRTKEGRTVQTSANKINFNLPLCHFDLMGKCNDDRCRWQHETDYRTSHKETLMDIASYVPSIAGLNELSPVDEHPRLIEPFVDQFIKLNSNLTDAEQCLRLLMEIYEKSGLSVPNYILPKPRKWKLSTTRRASLDLDDKKEAPLVSVKDRNGGTVINEDDVISGLDVRYWMLETREVEDLETAVTDCPSNVQLWIKLAYKKMSDLKRKANSEEILAIGMHVLSRGLEINESSETLWRHYLHLFGRREDKSELMNFYQMALNCAPSYYLYWKYLELKSTYSEKMEVCKAIRQFLCSPRCHDSGDVRSHHLLEVILYQAALGVETGRLKAGCEIIESVIRSRVSVIWLNLVWVDRILLWLVYIHLTEFRKLPASLYDPASSFPGPIVNKVPFSLPRSNDLKRRPSSNLKRLVDDALLSCSNSLTESSASAAWLYELYRLKLYLEEEDSGLDSSVRLCEQLLEGLPHFEELWICLIEKKSRAGDMNDLHKVIARALQQNPTSMHLHLASISIFLSQGESGKALECAEQCALNVFDVEAFDTAADPNLLFCKLLGQTLPCTYHPPKIRNGISEEWINDHNPHIWLCYCLLLDLQGVHDQAMEAYQAAMSTIKDGVALGTFCLRFLRWCYGAMKCRLPSYTCTSATDSTSRQRWLEFNGHVNRVLQIIPSKFPYPHDPEQSWINFSVQNEIVDLYISCLSDDNAILKSYEKFLIMMPTNVVLVRRACDFMLTKEYFPMCRGVCSAAIFERPKSMLLWTIKLILSHQDGNVTQMRKSFQAATSNLPFSHHLWKDFMLFEIAQKNSDGVQSIVKRCRQLQINIEESLNAVLSTSRYIPKPPCLEIKNK